MNSLITVFILLLIKEAIAYQHSKWMAKVYHDANVTNFQIATVTAISRSLIMTVNVVCVFVVAHVIMSW